MQNPLKAILSACALLCVSSCAGTDTIAPDQTLAQARSVAEAADALALAGEFARALQTVDRARDGTAIKSPARALLDATSDRLYRSARTAASYEVLRSVKEGNDEDVGSALVHWLQLTVSRGVFDRKAFEALPQPKPGAKTPKALLELTSWMQDVEKGLELDANDETRVAEANVDKFVFWLATKQRRVTMALAMRSLAASMGREAGSTANAAQLRTVAAIYEVALNLASREKGKVNCGPLLEPNLHEDPRAAWELQDKKDEFDVALAIAVDLAEFYDSHQGIENKEGTTGVSRERFLRLVRDPDGPLSRERWTKKQLTVSPAQKFQFYRALGLIFGTGTWLTEPEYLERGIEYLGLAVEEGRKQGRQVAHLQAKLAEALRKSRRYTLSLGRYVDSTREYFAQDDAVLAHRVGRSGLDLGYETADLVGTRVRDLEELLYHPRHGLYFGGQFGWIDGRNSAGELENELNRRFPGRSVTVSMEDNENGYKAYIGYRFATPFSIELGYAGLDGPESEINATVIDANLLADVRDLHPIAGHGPTFSVLGFPYENGNLSTFAKLGVWYWQADGDVDLASTNVGVHPEGLDVVVGLGFEYRILDNIGTRIEYERYFLDDQGVDMLSIGVTVRF